MEVCCRACKKKIDRNIAFKVVSNGVNYYYCNEREYQEKQAELEKNKYILDSLIEILDAQNNQISLIKSEIAKTIDVFNLNLFYFFMRENKDNLKNNMANKIKKSGEFETFFNKSKYCFAIIRNGIEKRQTHIDPKKDYSSEIRINVPVDISLAINMPQINKKQKRRGLDQIEEDYDGN